MYNLYYIVVIIGIMFIGVLSYLFIKKISQNTMKNKPIQTDEPNIADEPTQTIKPNLLKPRPGVQPPAPAEIPIKENESLNFEMIEKINNIINKEDQTQVNPNTKTQLMI